MNSQLANQIAQSLLDIGAVNLQPKDPFTWSSGLLSPIYCDNRLTMSYPHIRNSIAEGFVKVIKEKYSDVEVIAGTSTAGIPHAAWVADKLGLPMIYIRDKAKGHGKKNQIEGLLKPDQKVVVIEDLISTGGSSLRAAKAVEEAGGYVQAVIAIFTYQFEKASNAFVEENIQLHTLSNYTALIQIASDMGKVDSEDLELLQSWRHNPDEYMVD
ncbi:orotate phosphoribosyltransferase [Chengkuizengella sediminis]|uniref:orotate phosphoribosyltransferase n=1 Tax=Chengkuizengella sediminis TaxID=1885917 RepID=UPI0013898A44|nr:orotate phosphoribosyltransferase [Chengkuizengella sediminis]NDI33639.1 orotate phosphoribosyltransferase [Chengkuizengella sediminis]